MRISRLTAALPAALLCAGALQAQEAAEETIEEIVVTAAPLGDVLQPTSVFKGAELFTDRAPTTFAGPSSWAPRRANVTS